MWSRAVSGANQSGDEQNPWLMPQEQLPGSSAGVMSTFEANQSGGSSMGFACYPDRMSMTCPAPVAYDSSFAIDHSSMQDQISGFHYITPTQTQRIHPGISSTPTLTNISSPTFDGASLCAVESCRGVPAFYLPESAVPGMVQPWYACASNEQSNFDAPQQYINTYQTEVLPRDYQSTNMVSCNTVSQQGAEALSPVSQAETGETSQSIERPLSAEIGITPSVDAPKPGTAGDVGPGRKHRHYEMKPSSDGLYHCPYRTSVDPTTQCSHEPTKLKCNYDKYIDSHLKPYRCKQKGCEALRFSSTACRLRHEREAHGSHGHGDKPYRCKFPDCERSRPDRGFPRQWNRRDHMKRVHDYDEVTGKLGSDAGSSVAELSIATQPDVLVAPSPPVPSRKRAHQKSRSPREQPSKIRRRTASPQFEPSHTDSVSSRRKEVEVMPSVTAQWQMADVTGQWRERLIMMAHNLRRPEDVANIRREISTWDETASIHHV